MDISALMLNQRTGIFHTLLITQTGEHFTGFIQPQALNQLAPQTGNGKRMHQQHALIKAVNNTAVWGEAQTIGQHFIVDGILNRVLKTRMVTMDCILHKKLRIIFIIC